MNITYLHYIIIRWLILDPGDIMWATMTQPGDIMWIQNVTPRLLA